MEKECPICDYPFKNGDDVVAIMVTKFKLIDSNVNYALEQPTKCVEVVHSDCFDWDDYDDRPEETIEP